MVKKALLIGVGQYEAGLPPLAAAPKDVAATAILIMERVYWLSAIYRFVNNC